MLFRSLTTFVADKNSFAAEEGANDDLVMGLVMFAWTSTQPYFKEIVSHDIRKQMQLENMNQVDDDTLPEMIMNDGVQRDLEFMDGDLWELNTGAGETYASFMNDFRKNL